MSGLEQQVFEPMRRISGPIQTELTPSMSLPPTLDQVGWEIPASLDLPRTLDRLWGNFPSYDAIGRLEAPMDFMNSVGVLLPMELWGRCVLYSCLNASHFTWASANDKNQF